MLTVAVVQIKDLLRSCAPSEKEKYDKLFAISQRALDKRSAQDHLPSAPRIRLVIDIRNHQQPPDFDQHQQLTREGFDELVAGILSPEAYGTQRVGFGQKIRNSQDNALGRGCSKAAVLDLYGVYTLLFGTEENDFSLGLTDQWRIKLNKKLDKVKREYTASKPIDEWASSRYVLWKSDSQ